MGTPRRDQMPRVLGGPLTRRAVLGGVGAGGMAAILSAAGGRGPARGAAQEATPTPDEHPPGSTFKVHGQLVLGEETIYLYHLPMFMYDRDFHPHNFQVVLEVGFAPSRSDPQSVYRRDRQQSGATLYTLEPDEFELIDLVRPARDRAPLRSFRGNLYRGHFERPGHEALLTVTVDVERIVYLQSFRPDAEPLPELEYLVFGKGRERFLAHLITRPPEFDQVLSVVLTGDTFADDELRRGVRISVPGRANTIGDRLRPSVAGAPPIIGRVRGADGDAATGTPVAAELQIEVLSELYFEEGELRLPAEFPTTPEEEAAGF